MYCFKEKKVDELVNHDICKTSQRSCQKNMLKIKQKKLNRNKAAGI